jgi:predicted metal-dependent hydrolase
MFGLLASREPYVYNPCGNNSKKSAENWMSPNAEATDAEAYDPLYLAGIEHFNVCDFFEAHETWEELWTEYRGPARKFYQGLIQVAVALHHFGNGNIRGAKKVYHSSRNYLAEYVPFYEGLNLEEFLAQYERCFVDVLANEEEFPRIEIVPDLIPEIHLQTATNS